MTWKAGIALALVVSLMIAVQRYGLDRQPETITEAPMKQLKGLPASSALPTYIASLFFGAFRAIAVDILWIQLRKVEEEKRWYERREIIQLISYVQPRNPEVWSHLGWHSAYNVANGFTDPEKSWEWVKFGILWLRRGVQTLPHEPYIKNELARTLWHKAAWDDGKLDLGLLKRIEEDAEIQAKLLPDGMKSDRPLSAFEFAVIWFERAGAELLDRDIKLTQMGLYLYPDTMDGFARACMVAQGMYDWKMGRREEAKSWFRRAQKHVEEMLARTPDAPKREGTERRYRNNLSPIFKDWVEMYKSYPDLVDLEHQAKSGKPEDELALLIRLQAVLVKHGPIDEHWFWGRYNPHALLNRLKMKVVKGADTQECNDSIDLGTDFRPGDLAVANFAPEGHDVDTYWLSVTPPEGVNPPPERPLRPVTVGLKFKRPPSARLDLRITVYNAHRQPILERALDPKAAGSAEGVIVPFSAPDYGRYFLRIEPADPATPWPADTRYQFQYDLER